METESYSVVSAASLTFTMTDENPPFFTEESHEDAKSVPVGDGIDTSMMLSDDDDTENKDKDPIQDNEQIEVEETEDKYNRRILELSESLRKRDARIEKLKGEADELDEEAEVLNRSLKEANSHIAALKREVAEKDKSLQELLMRHKTVERKLEEYQSKSVARFPEADKGGLTGPAKVEVSASNANEQRKLKLLLQRAAKMGRKATTTDKQILRGTHGVKAISELVIEIEKYISSHGGYTPSDSTNVSIPVTKMKGKRKFGEDEQDEEDDDEKRRTARRRRRSGGKI